VYWIPTSIFQDATNNDWELDIDSVTFGPYGNASVIDMAYFYNDRFIELPGGLFGEIFDSLYT
jgi:hypothetical protein